MFAAGLVPGLTFVVEWLVVTRKIHPLSAAERPAQTTEGSAQPLDDGAVGLAPALAHRLVAVAATRGLQVVQQGPHQADAAGPERMTDGDGATAG